MKKLSFAVLSLAALSVTWVSCNKEESSDVLLDNNNTLTAMSSGIAHNEILSNYFDELESSTTRTEEDLTLEEKIIIVDNYLDEINYEGSFSDILENSPLLYVMLPIFRQRMYREFEYCITESMIWMINFIYNPNLGL